VGGKGGAGRAGVCGGTERVWVIAEAYVDALRSASLEVVEVEADESCPDCVFVEDTLLAVDRENVILCPMGSPSRQPELPAMEAAARRLGYAVHRLDGGPGAVLDGGDVLRVGDVWFVGLTRRTNQAAVDALRRALRSRHPAACSAVVAVPFAHHADVLHLKSVCSTFGDDAVAIVAGAIGDAVEAAVLQHLPRFSILRVPDAPAANVVSANGTVLIRAATEFPSSAPLLRSAATQRHLRSVELDGSELAKVDGALTCGSVLLF
jgi:dimethylargininase